MTVAQKIKRMTQPMSTERGVEAAVNCIKYNIEYLDGVDLYLYTFIDGSSLLHRYYH